MEQLIVFLLACYGVTNIITGGKITESVRDFFSFSDYLYYWVHCPMCMGVPVGIMWSLIGLNPIEGFSFYVTLAMSGAISSAFCWATHVFMNYLGEQEL